MDYSMLNCGDERDQVYNSNVIFRFIKGFKFVANNFDNSKIVVELSYKN